MGRRILVVCVAALATTGKPAAAQGGADERAVLAVIDSLFAGMRRRDTSLVRSTFEPGARLVGIRSRNGEETVQSLTVEQWVNAIARDRRPDWTERAWSPDVRIRGTLASVWAPYDFHFGSTPSHCGIDAVQLLRVKGTWKIVSIADTFETTDCPRRPPP